MISCDLIGCLGNQLFQVAAVYALAQDNNDTCAFKFYHREKHALSGHGPEAYKNNIYSHLKELPEDWKPEIIYKEPVNDYFPIPYHPNMLVEESYLSSIKFFDHRREEILGLFLREKLISRIQGNFKNSLSIHVRRGDYLKRPTVHPTLTMKYYNKALEYIDSRVKIDIIYVFTENKNNDMYYDLDWCKDNLKDPRIIYVSSDKDYMDLYTMSLCEHHIIANSSFSWWGSYLCKNKDKIIVSPKVWHGDGLKVKPTVFFCDNWVLIDN